MRVSRRQSAIGHAILIGAACVALYPFLSVLLLALGEPGSRTSGFSLPTSISFANFTEAWDRGLDAQPLLSSLLVATAVVIGTLVMAVLAGYAFAVFPFPLKGVFLVLLLAGLVMPYEATVIPLYYQLKDWGLVNTYAGLILPQIGLSLPFAIFWMRTFFVSTPAALREAASVDGASRLRTLRSVLLPMALPAIGTLATLLFLFAWNEFLLALVLVPDDASVQTAPLALSFFSGNRRNSDPGVTAAAAVLVALPVLIAYLALQRRMISGMLAGAVKE
ncbi:carbohydrate ABC transporter permease [Streptomyces sp. WAC 06738]|jgi:raffinose/stachyose/melibiose transport system permease protein|uniref:carbohydrate ABC transporter permease n=1 Tax=Streptomyces sp. WAC 06738 TaxID=2203210 RepID=UPI000F6E4E0C|nr:carbohydrate ABC transporter permease [Streptomyces sp. WAC 06738]AZM50225.1 carbohydrate ABC transporter permease [Streptomyces sp. WAC 06738]